MKVKNGKNEGERKCGMRGKFENTFLIEREKSRKRKDRKKENIWYSFYKNYL